jgi:hypothetical protein
MLSPTEIANIKAELENLENALRNCNAGSIRRVIEDWILEAKQTLASGQGKNVARND